MRKMRNVLQKQTQEVRSSFNFELPLNGPPKKIHNQTTSFSAGKAKNI